MTNWRESLEDKLAEIDLWAVNQVNSGLENLSAQREQLFTELKDRTQVQGQIKAVGQKLGGFTRSLWEKRPKNKN